MDQKKFLSEVKNLINKWSKSEVKVHAFNQNLTQKPDYLSVIYKQHYMNIINIVCGSVFEPEGSSNRFNSSYEAKAFIGDKIQGLGGGYGYLNQLPRDPELLKRRINESLDLAVKYASGNYFLRIGSSIKIKKHAFIKLSNESVVKDVRDVPNKAPAVSQNIVDIMKEWSANHSKKSHIKDSRISLLGSLDTRLFVDSEGREILDHAISGQVSWESSVVQPNNGILEYGDSIHLIGSCKEIESRLLTALKVTDKYTLSMVNAQTPISDEYPVVFTGKAAGTLFHEGLGGHLLSGSYIKNGFSTIFKGQLGKQILPSFISVIDTPDVKGPGKYHYDEEGIKAKRITLVKNGVLKSYLLDRESAHFFQTSSNGRSRRGKLMGLDEDSEPILLESEPRVGNLEIMSSNTLPDNQMINYMLNYCKNNGLEAGILLDSSSGSVMVDSGEFRIIPKRAWKISVDDDPVCLKDFFVLGKPYELLKNIVITGTKRQVSGGSCGASSGYVPTQEASPSIFIPKVSIQSYECDPVTDTLLTD